MPLQHRQDVGSPMSMDEICEFAGMVGKFWRHKRRKKWPGDLKDTVAALLLDLRILIAPSAELGGLANIQHTRSDIRGLSKFLSTLATKSDNSKRCSSTPPSWKPLNADAPEFVPSVSAMPPLWYQVPLI